MRYIFGRRNYYIAISPPIQVRRKNGYIFRGGGRMAMRGKWLYNTGTGVCY
jgi:hypothetical protein